MAVYVSGVMKSIPSNKWPWKHHSYLMADSIDELHAFAAKIGFET